MPKYLVERDIPDAGQLTAVELRAIAQQFLLVQRQLGSNVDWIHSTLTENRLVCLFVAENEMLLKEHSRRCGLPFRQITEVSAVIGPSTAAVDNNE